MEEGVLTNRGRAYTLRDNLENNHRCETLDPQAQLVAGLQRRAGLGRHPGSLDEKVGFAGSRTVQHKCAQKLPERQLNRYYTGECPKSDAGGNGWKDWFHLK